VGEQFKLPANLEQLARDANYCVKELALRCGRSVRQLERDFKSELGITPSVFLSHLWYDDAQEALAREGSVLSAALDMGYKHFGNFSRDFKKASGSSPSRQISRGASGK